jgi:ClpP class serine protease
MVTESSLFRFVFSLGCITLTFDFIRGYVFPLFNVLIGTAYYTRYLSTVLKLIISNLVLSLSFYHVYEWYRSTNEEETKYDELEESILQWEEENDSKLIILTNDVNLDDDICSALKSRIIEIDNEDKFIRFIRNAKKNESDIDIIIHTFGGYIASSDLIANMIINYKYNVNVYVLSYCFSAGTIIALSADKLYMDSNSYLGPIDPQVIISRNYYSKDIFSACTISQDNTNSLYQLIKNKSEQLVNDSRDTIKLIFNDKLNNNEINKLCQELISDKYPHHKPLSVTYLTRLGIEIETNIPEMIDTIFNKFLNMKIELDNPLDEE